MPRRKKNKSDPFWVGEKQVKQKAEFIHSSFDNQFEEILFSGYKKGDSQKREFIGTSINQKRIYFLLLIIFAVFAVLFLRAGQLQIIKGTHYRDLAEENRIRVKIINAERGIIYDRNGFPLVENIPSFSAVIIPADLPHNKIDKERVIKKAAKLNNVEESYIWKLLEGVPTFSYQPILLRDNLSYNEAIILNIKSVDLPGIVVETGVRRHYLLDGGDYKSLSLSHVLGYEGKITEEELKQNEGYSLIDRIGKEGIEATYESALRGRVGRKKIEVDALGQEKKILTELPAIPGNDLKLTIDLQLQSYAETVLKKYLKNRGLKKGAIVALNPQNGEILASISLPSFNNNDFALGISHEKYRELLENPNKPLFNRAIRGEYPSGSTFKPIVALAALEEGIINKNTTFLSTGGIRIGNIWWFPDWKAGGHGLTNVVRAIAESINTFFYIVGGGYKDFKGLGVERITEYAKKFGLGDKLGIDIPGESKGFLPGKKWKKDVKGEKWYIGDTYHYAIGQGDLLVTPLQVVSWISVFANGGILYRPHLVNSIINKEGNVVKKISKDVLNEKFTSSYNIQVVRQGLRRAVLSGSARRLGDLPVSAAGKTGTAQWNSKKPPHAWFVGFAPYEDPKIAIVVLVEEGGEGSDVALSVTKEILNWYFFDRNNK